MDDGREERRWKRRTMMEEKNDDGWKRRTMMEEKNDDGSGEQ